ncbi:MAG: hypothetical protein A2W80_01200 [Candidatus Riflebacteria bacterium GWC2_50_8]|nr:MAG: hypothetical protein A2W80_01200 [Candidatus Riflebacteria bacterium GWC2_50_8]
MRLKRLLSEKKSAVLRRWFDDIVETYPPDTSQFLKKQKNQFANPVGSTILQGIENIFDGLLKGLDKNEISPFLDNIIRIRAVQDFTPPQALSFIFLLKKIIRNEIAKEISDNELSEELLEFESEIDNLALISFDIYMQCREKLYEIKANEVKRMTFRLLQQANLLTEIKDEESDIKEHDFININTKGGS